MIYTSEYYAVETLGVTERRNLFCTKAVLRLRHRQFVQLSALQGCAAILLEDRPPREHIRHDRALQLDAYFGVPTLYAPQVALMEKGRKIDMRQTRMCPAGSRCRPR